MTTAEALHKGFRVVDHTSAVAIAEELRALRETVEVDASAATAKLARASTPDREHA